MIQLPLNIVAKGKGKSEQVDREMILPQLEASVTISVPAPEELEGSTGDGLVRTFRSAK